tara:strand:+ start:64 stop:912 length:849 start_codon:yes stop_codon:yes gene_type:complete
MLNFFDNPRDNIIGLQALAIVCIFIIGCMLYYMSETTDTLNSEINDLKSEVNTLELECPACPAHPKIPACPKCPTLTCPSINNAKCPDCPDCNCPENDECPACPDCSASADCPTVDDIVGGIFPGRNPGITSGGKYFNIQANESYELLPDYDFYQPVDAFPTDSILEQPLRFGNVALPEDAIENSIDSSLVNTDESRSLNMGRMDMASSGDTTGATSLSKKFGSGTEKTFGSRGGIISARESQERAASQSGGADMNRALREVMERNRRESDTRRDLESGAGE